MEIITCDGIELISAISEYVDTVLSQKISLKSSFSVGLSGGSIVDIIAKVFKKLPDSKYKQIHFFFCDERFVDKIDSNDLTFNLYNEVLFSKRETPSENVHKINLLVELVDATMEYKTDIENYFNVNSDTIPKFDLLFLGIGPDGHTASLFPNHKLLNVTDKVIDCLDDSPKPPSKRITMTLPLINNAHHICFISVGESKASIVQTCITKYKLGGYDQYPASLVRPYNGRLIWFLNQGSAQLCNKLTYD